MALPALFSPSPGFERFEVLETKVERNRPLLRVSRHGTRCSAYLLLQAARAWWMRATSKQVASTKGPGLKERANLYQYGRDTDVTHTAQNQ